MTARPLGIGAGKENHREVWQIAWPSVATMMLQTINTLMDVFFVGHLPNGKDALAATGVGGGAIFLLIALAMGVSVGATALVARFTGAQDHASAVEAAGQSITLSVLLSLFFFGLFFYLRRDVASWLLGGASSAAAMPLAVSFLTAALISTTPLFLLNGIMGVFRGLGDTRTPMLIQAAIIATHISLNATLIYGLLGMPRMGVAGAGTALASSQFVGAGLYLVALKRRSPLEDALSVSRLKYRPEWAARILRVGVPAALQAVLRNLAALSFTGMLARAVEGAAGVAAMQIGIRAEGIAFMPGFGFSVAAAALVGQSLGAGEPERAEQCGLAAMWQAIGVMALMAAGFYVFSAPLAGLFTSDHQVRSLGADYLRVNAFCEPFLGIGMVLTGALQGAGDTLRPTLITIFTMWLVR
ncbi:MAG TPA: MATE family efflux transporter, partial [Chthonomonadales bacterium]|nr:MATE family efflux transporter [Chthonomonadales bacterium]